MLMWTDRGTNSNKRGPQTGIEIVEVKIQKDSQHPLSNRVLNQLEKLPSPSGRKLKEASEIMGLYQNKLLRVIFQLLPTERTKIC